MDPLSPQQRHTCMSRIRSRDTKPELLIRKGLFRRGFRYRLNGCGLPGRPDLVFRKWRAAVFVHGCFWHGHECPMFKWPKSNREFWAEKINRNRQRDRYAEEQLLSAGWRILTVWECSLRGSNRLDLDAVLDLSAQWLTGSACAAEVQGQRERL